MANPEHLRRAKRYSRQRLQGLKKWREEMESGFNLQTPASFHPDFIDLTGADLSGADLSGLTLYRTKLEKANFVRTDLRHCDLSRANLRGANLTKADLAHTNLNEANLEGTNLSESILFYTVFANVDLAHVKGLSSAHIDGPVIISIETLYRSEGKIPESFLRNCGIPEEIIEVARSIRNGPPIQWHSCFISHSTKDDEFARRLHARMREANMRVWFAPEDLGGGKKLYDQIVDAIPRYDKLLVVLSENSIKSEWVMTEIRKARETEKKEKRRKLFPIRLCDFETLRDWTCFDADTGKDLAVEVREYFIPDFSNWKVLADGHPAAFESAFARLKKDLEAENQKPK